MPSALLSKDLCDQIKARCDHALSRFSPATEQALRRTVARVLPRRHTWHSEQWAFLATRRILTKYPDGVVVDVGAHRGKFARYCHAMAPFKQYHLFEPIPELCTELRRRFAPYRMHVHECALSDSTRERPFYVCAAASSQSGLYRNRLVPDPPERVLSLNPRLLDDELPPDARARTLLIKIDAEGAELEVLRGTRQILKASRPFVLFEHVHEWQVTSRHTRELYQLFTEAGLKVAFIRSWLDRRAAFTAEEFVAAAEHRLATDFLAYCPDR